MYTASTSDLPCSGGGGRYDDEVVATGIDIVPTFSSYRLFDVLVGMAGLDQRENRRCFVLLVGVKLSQNDLERSV